jgi:pullulanase
MPLPADVLLRRASNFVLWRPNADTIPPVLILGQFRPGNPPTLAGERRIAMSPVAGVGGLWQVTAAASGLSEGDIAHYWFEVDDTRPHRATSGRVRCADPMAHT